MHVNGLRMKTGRLGMYKKEEEPRKVNEIIIIMAWSKIFDVREKNLKENKISECTTKQNKTRNGEDICANINKSSIELWNYRLWYAMLFGATWTSWIFLCMVKTFSMPLRVFRLVLFSFIHIKWHLLSYYSAQLKQQIPQLDS